MYNHFLNQFLVKVLYEDDDNKMCTILNIYSLYFICCYVYICYVNGG